MTKLIFYKDYSCSQGRWVTVSVSFSIWLFASRSLGHELNSRCRRRWWWVTTQMVMGNQSPGRRMMGCGGAQHAGGVNNGRNGFGASKCYLMLYTTVVYWLCLARKCDTAFTLTEFRNKLGSNKYNIFEKNSG